MPLKYYFIIGLLALIIILSGCSSGPGKYDAFAQCLTEHNVKMYGAYWCPHCLNQKEDFGKSWQYVNYIECSLPGNQGQTEICATAGITGYPTWEFGDGSRLSGEVPLSTLSRMSGCSLTGNVSG